MATTHAGWTKIWPTEPGWYWFCILNPVFGARRVEPAHVRKVGGPHGKTLMYTRAGAIFHEGDYKHAWWHLMKQPPEPPEVPE
jgi:hypothetical protein